MLYRSRSLTQCILLILILLSGSSSLTHAHAVSLQIRFTLENDEDGSYHSLSNIADRLRHQHFFVWGIRLPGQIPSDVADSENLVDIQSLVSGLFLESDSKFLIIALGWRMASIDASAFRWVSDQQLRIYQKQSVEIDHLSDRSSILRC